MSGADRVRVEDFGGDRYKLVKQAEQNYRRVAMRLARVRKALAHAEADYEDAKRGLDLASRVVQPSLPAVGVDQAGLPV